MDKLLATTFFLFFSFPLFSQQTSPLIVVDDLEGQQKWVDSMYSNMSLHEKIGQLFMVRAFSHDDPQHIRMIEGYIKDYHLGGLCFFQGSPQKQIELINK